MKTIFPGIIMILFLLVSYKKQKEEVQPVQLSVEKLYLVEFNFHLQDV